MHSRTLAQPSVVCLATAGAVVLTAALAEPILQHLFASDFGFRAVPGRVAEFDALGELPVRAENSIRPGIPG